MKRCVSIIDDYTRLSPSSLPAPVVKASPVPMPSGEVKKERKQRTTKPKDPNAPKRPPSAYILFQNDVRDGLRKSNPEMAYKDLLGVISQKWKDLPENQKKVCLDIDPGLAIVKGKHWIDIRGCVSGRKWKIPSRRGKLSKGQRSSHCASTLCGA